MSNASEFAMVVSQIFSGVLTMWAVQLSTFILSFPIAIWFVKRLCKILHLM